LGPKEERIHYRLTEVPRLGSFFTGRVVPVPGGGAPMLNRLPPLEAGDPNGLPIDAVPAGAPFGCCPNVNAALVVAGDCGNPDTLVAGEDG